MSIFFNNEAVWRWLTNFWTVALIVFLVVNFVAQDKYEFLTPAFSIIYTAVLSLYVGTKEFERWYDMHEGRHPGEWFVAAWTVVLFTMLVVWFVDGPQYKVPSEIVADYIMVLSIFAVTQKSKRMHARKTHTKIHKHPPL